MANPTSEQIFGVNTAAVDTALTALGLTNPTGDARLAAQKIVSRLQENYETLVSGTANLNTYDVAKEAENIDTDTQRQIYTFTIDMKLTAISVDNEP